MITKTGSFTGNSWFSRSQKLGTCFVESLSCLSLIKTGAPQTCALSELQVSEVSEHGLRLLRLNICVCVCVWVCVGGCGGVCVCVYTSLFVCLSGYPHSQSVCIQFSVLDIFSSIILTSTVFNPLFSRQIVHYSLCIYSIVFHTLHQLFSLDL